jgi:hypothetical protein
MSVMDDNGFEPADAEVQPPVAARLDVPGEPAGVVVEALLGALHRGEITSKFAREALVRLVPAAKPTVRLRLPRIVDAASYAAVTQRIMKASSTGKIAPGDAATLLKNARSVYQAVSAANRARFSFR